MAQQAAAHQTAMSETQDEAERMREAMADKHTREKEKLLADHAEAVAQAESRWGPPACPWKTAKALCQTFRVWQGLLLKLNDASSTDD